MGSGRLPTPMCLWDIVWHLLANPAARFRDLGPDYHTNKAVIERWLRNHIAQLAAMGYRVTLEPTV